MLDLLRRIFGREQPADATRWHRWDPALPVRLIDGTWSADVGQIWRRLHDGQWQYQQDPETDAEWEARQW